MNDRGWIIVPEVIDPELLRRLRQALPYAWVECSNIMHENGIDDADNTVHHLLATQDPGPWLDLIAALEPLDPIFTGYFGGSKYVLHSLGGSINTKGHDNYASRIHRDIRTHQREPFVLNTLVMLDDFTAENGATWLGGRTPFARGSESFYENATQAIGSAGSVLIFDSNIWHCSGTNYTDKPRRSITPLLCKPFVRPGFDYPRALGYDRDGISVYQRLVIGYNARIPATLSEWYQPEATRMYRKEQG